MTDEEAKAEIAAAWERFQAQYEAWRVEELKRRMVYFGWFAAGFVTALLLMSLASCR